MEANFLKKLSSKTLVGMVVDMALAIKIQDKMIDDLHERIDELHRENFNHVDELGSLRSQLSQLKNGVGNISKGD
uniref:Uncharacterized protein n=1 Tax=viral metagenome TaxID=1070528 RepID=A0A6M3IK97_9ZZZZ